MCLGCMHCRAPHVILKQNNCQNSPNMQPILTFFLGLFKFMKRHLFKTIERVLSVCYWQASFFPFFVIFSKFQPTYAFHFCVEYGQTNLTPLNKIWCNRYIRKMFCNSTCIYVLLNSEKKAGFNYRGFDLKDDLVGVSYKRYLSGQPFITILKLVWRELDMVAMNDWKKKGVGWQRTWVSKHNVQVRCTACKISSRTQHERIWG